MMFRRQSPASLWIVVALLSWALGVCPLATPFLAQAQAQEAPGAAEVEPPFKTRVPAPSLDGGLGWLNTPEPLDLKDLRGKFVLLDFWTYCCINCMHVLPELKKLEHAYPNELVVIGVHSAKFEAEKETENIRKAILRYEIEHPVVNDANHAIWRKYGVSSWPTLVLIDPEGYAVWARGGENTFEFLNTLLQHGLPYYRERGLLNTKPLEFNFEAKNAVKTPLRFPGKVLADEAGGRLFITDSNHNRIVITDLQGKLLDIIGSGVMGRADGGYDQATFDHPQGVALDGEMLYVADTENHLLRKVDLKQKQVTTIAGTGKQMRGVWPGMKEVAGAPAGQVKLPRRFVGPPLETDIASPWALVVHDKTLYIAMAGPHQIWKMTLDGKEIGPYAGNGREDITDGPLLPSVPYELGYSSFAQPSGLSSDGTWIYVADSEGSSVRAVPLNPRAKVKTIIGTAHLPRARLFEFGDIDGPAGTARLQHVLGVVFYRDQLYIADTYNHKIKVIDLKDLTSQTLVGTGERGASDDPAQFNEPAGITAAAGKLYVADTNNHLIRVIDLDNGNKVSTLTIEGLTPPVKQEKVALDSVFSGATPVTVPEQTVQARDGQVTLRIKLQLPLGWKINPLAPQRYQVTVEGDSGPIVRQGLGSAVKVDPPAAEFDVTLPVQGTGEEKVTVSLAHYTCQIQDAGICTQGVVAWTLPVKIVEQGATEPIELSYQIP